VSLVLRYGMLADLLAAKGLKALIPQVLTKHLQVSDGNPMAGLDGRCNLLIQLGSALEARPDICKTGRPGDMLGTPDFFRKFPVNLSTLHAGYFQSRFPSTSTPYTLPLTILWSTLFDLLLPIWPSRTTLPSHPDFALGDVWPCPSLARSLKERKEGEDLVPFHKLSQWLCYSLVEPIESQARWKVERGRGQTGLPEVSWHCLKEGRSAGCSSSFDGSQLTA